MWDALCSFVFNLGLEGSRQQIARINARAYEECAYSFDLYINANGRPFQGLINRRNEEEALFRKDGLNPLQVPKPKPKPSEPVSAGKPYAPCPVPMHISGGYRLGDMGDGVYFIQCALIGLGYLRKPADGELVGNVFNEHVEYAVKQFQRDFFDHEDEADGIVGSATRAALELALTRARAPKPLASKILDVPYYSQRDFGGSEAWNICGVTSAAMVLKFWGIGVTPDNVLRAYGKAAGQSPSGLEGIFESNKLKADSTYNGSLEAIRKHVEAGRPCVVHGNFTRSGHILVVVGFDGSDVICNDPAGEWEEYVGDSYFDNPKNGKAVRYNIDNFAKAAGRSSGVWYSVAWGN
jgi:peptidoglycan hydrolase-like protein with peptidoglycan-binding domain